LDDKLRVAAADEEWQRQVTEAAHLDTDLVDTEHQLRSKREKVESLRGERSSYAGACNTYHDRVLVKATANGLVGAPGDTSSSQYGQRAEGRQVGQAGSG
jgi:hypothetical protein